METRLNATLENASLRDALTLATIIKAPYGSSAFGWEEHFNQAAQEGARAGLWDENTALRLMESGPNTFTNQRCDGTTFP